jgi:hypothetical protein
MHPDIPEGYFHHRCYGDSITPKYTAQKRAIRHDLILFFSSAVKTNGSPIGL